MTIVDFIAWATVLSFAAGLLMGVWTLVRGR